MNHHIIFSEFASCLCSPTLMKSVSVLLQRCKNNSSALSPSWPLWLASSHRQRPHQRRRLELPWHSRLPVHVGISFNWHIRQNLSARPPLVWNNPRLCPWVKLVVVYSASGIVESCTHGTVPPPLVIHHYLLCSLSYHLWSPRQPSQWADQWERVQPQWCCQLHM